MLLTEWQLSDFLPAHRSFTVAGLERDSDYWLRLLCTDRAGLLHSSDTLQFHTGGVLFRQCFIEPGKWWRLGRICGDPGCLVRAAVIRCLQPADWDPVF